MYKSQQELEKLGDFMAVEVYILSTRCADKCRSVMGTIYWTPIPSFTVCSPGRH